MKYFAREWATGELSDEESERIVSDYWVHIDTLLPSLPPAVAALARDINLHDGLIHRVLVQPEQRRLELELRCGDLQVGYFDLDLIYSEVRMDLLDIPLLQALARDRQTEVLYDEVDLDESNYVHRILFWPEGEIAIVFRSLQVIRTPRADRSIYDFEKYGE